MNTPAPSAFVDFVFNDSFSQTKDFKEIPAAHKFGTPESVKPLMDTVESELVALEDALQHISPNLNSANSLLKEVQETRSWLLNLDSENHDEYIDITNALSDIFDKKVPSLRNTVIGDPDSISFDNALDIAEKLLSITDTASENNTKWVELTDNTKLSSLCAQLTSTIMKKVGVEENPVPDMKLFGLSKYDKYMTQMLIYGTAVQLHKQSGKNETFLNDYDRDHKAIGSIMIANGEALNKFLQDTWSRFNIEQNIDGITCHYEVGLFEEVRDNVARFKAFMSINEYLTAGWSTLKSQINGIDKTASDLIKSASSLEYVRDEVKNIFEEYDISRYDRNFKAADSTNTDWYKEYFDFDESHPGLMAIQELVEPHMRLQDTYQNDIDFLKLDLKEFETTLLKEEARHKTEGKELQSVGRYWDRVAGK